MITGDYFMAKHKFYQTELLASEAERWMKETPHGKMLAFVAKSNAKCCRIEVDEMDRLVISVDEPAQDFKANKRFEEVIAAWIGVAKRNVRVCRGHKSKLKSVLID